LNVFDSAEFHALKSIDSALTDLMTVASWEILPGVSFCDFTDGGANTQSEKEKKQTRNISLALT
jgi:hypothetical protein